MTRADGCFISFTPSPSFCLSSGAAEEPRRPTAGNVDRMRFRRERNWRQRLESGRRPADPSSSPAMASSSKANADLVDALRQLHRQDLQAFENTRQEERAEDRQERRQEKQEREEDRATTHRMIAAIERSHQTLADLMGRQTSAMEAIATAFSAPKYPSPSLFPGFSPPWSAQQAAPNSGERQASASGSNTMPLPSPTPDEPGMHVPAGAQDLAPGPDPAPGPLCPSTSLEPFPPLMNPSPGDSPATSLPAPVTHPSATSKQSQKRKNCD